MAVMLSNLVKSVGASGVVGGLPNNNVKGVSTPIPADSPQAKKALDRRKAAKKLTSDLSAADTLIGRESKLGA